MGKGARIFNHAKHYHNSCTCKYKNINAYASLIEYQNKSKVVRALMACIQVNFLVLKERKLIKD